MRLKYVPATSPDNEFLGYSSDKNVAPTPQLNNRQTQAVVLGLFIQSNQRVDIADTGSEEDVRVEIGWNDCFNLSLT